MGFWFGCLGRKVKETIMNTTLKILGVALFLSLTACQQDGKSQAMQTAETYVTSVSRAFAKKTTSSSSRGLASYTTSTNNVFDPFSSGYSLGNYAGPSTSYQPWTSGSTWNSQWAGVNSNNGTYGAALMYPSMADESTRCQQMVASIPAKMENLDFMMGTLERCLYRLAIHKSSPMNYLWRNDNPQILNYSGYLNDYARPGQYGQYAQSPYTSFLLNGQTQYLPAASFGSNNNSLYPSSN
jgi:hypothetical protein